MNAPSNAPFPLGVASFDPLTDRVLLWTSHAGAGTCDWEVSTDPDLREVVATGTVEAEPDTGLVTVDATGLEPATTYWYRFGSDGATSPVGRTRTLPAGTPTQLRVGVTCCARFGQSCFEVYGALAEADVDVVVHLGDYVYEDTKCEIDGREPDPDHDCVTLDDYRRRHAQARRDPDLQALHARHPMIAVWDDHDIADNAWRGGAKSHDPDQQGPWGDRLAAALRAHQEHLPKRLADPAEPSSAWRRLDAGDLVSIVCSETRAHRDEQAGIEGAADADDHDRTMLGAEQRNWLIDAISDPAPRWVLLASGTVVSELTIDAPDSLDGVLPEKYAVVEGSATNTDQWDGYLAEREQVAAALGQRAGGNLVVSGDIHSAWAIEGPLGPDGAPVAVELVCPPAATTPIGQLLPQGVGTLLGPALVEQLEHVRWVDVDHHGYLILDVTRDRTEAAWWWVDPEDGDEPPQLGRRWVVPRSTPVALIDPEPPSDPVPSRSPLSDLRRTRRRRVALAGAGAAAVAGLVLFARRSGRLLP